MREPIHHSDGAEGDNDGNDAGENMGLKSYHLEFLIGL